MLNLQLSYIVLLYFAALEQPATNARVRLRIIIISIYQISGQQFSRVLIGSVTWNILGYSLFRKRREKWHVVSQKFQKKKLWSLMKQHFFIHVIW